MTSKLNGIELIKPSKLVIQQKSPLQFPAKPTTTSYIRPATFSYTNINSDMSNQKLVVRKDLGYHNLNQRHVVSSIPATVTRPSVVQHNEANVKTAQVLLQQKNEKLLIKSALAPANTENSSLKSLKNNDIQVPIDGVYFPKEVMSKRKSLVVPMLHQKYLDTVGENPRMGIASVPPPKCKPSVLNPMPTGSSIKAITTKWPRALKTQPTATVTSSSMPVQVVNLGMFIFFIANTHVHIDEFFFLHYENKFFSKRIINNWCIKES